MASNVTAIFKKTPMRRRSNRTSSFQRSGTIYFIYAGTSKMTTSYDKWVWERAEAHINWSVGPFAPPVVQLVTSKPSDVET